MEKQKEVQLTEEEKAELLQKRKKAALMSFIFGLVALFLGGGLLGIIFSALALGQAKKAKGELTGASKVFRIVGKVLGILMLILSILGLIFRILACIGLIVFAIIAVIAYLIPIIGGAIEGMSALALLL